MKSRPHRARLTLLGATLGSIALIAGSGATAGAEDGAGGVGPATGPVGDSSEGQFPVRGKHTYGDGLGAGRNHQGQDLIAACGLPVVAAQPGRVKYKDYDGGGGNYVVIDGSGRLEDTVYMHLLKPTSLGRRESVEAGEVIGRVGTTGSSTTCHLHFEMWSGPGWYDGGEPIDPKPYLKRWDRAGRR